MHEKLSIFLIYFDNKFTYLSEIRGNKPLYFFTWKALGLTDLSPSRKLSVLLCVSVCGDKAIYSIREARTSITIAVWLLAGNNVGKAS